jgi:hypothetical protein
VAAAGTSLDIRLNFHCLAPSVCEKSNLHAIQLPVVRGLKKRLEYVARNGLSDLTEIQPKHHSLFAAAGLYPIGTAHYPNR